MFFLGTNIFFFQIITFDLKKDKFETIFFTKYENVIYIILSGFEKSFIFFQYISHTNIVILKKKYVFGIYY